MRIASRLVLALGIFFALHSAAQADVNVFVQFGDGRVLLAPRSVYVSVYSHQGGFIVAGLPAGYINEPYGYYQGHPVYYHQNYWHHHNRHWSHDPDGRYRHDDHHDRHDDHRDHDDHHHHD